MQVIGDKRRYRDLRQGTTATYAVPADLIIIPLLLSLQLSFPDHAQVPLALGFIMSVLGRRGAIELRALAVSPNLSAASTLRPFSVLNRPPPNYPGHVPLTTIERGALALGSAIGSLINPRRAGA